MNRPVNESTLAVTPLHAWHVAQGARMAPFAGFEMPIQYQGIVAEHQACRTSAALFDVSHMGRLRFDGEGAEELLDHLLTRRVVGMPIGAVKYALMCNEEGGVLDDVLVSHLQTPSGSQYHLLVVNASNREKITRWIMPHLADFPKVTMSDRTALTAMIAIQGPRAVDVTSRLFRAKVDSLKRYRAVITDQFQKPVIVSRTGYTGEDGFELIVRAEEAKQVWENVMLAGRAAGFCAAGLGARDTLRLEAAMPLYGHELTEQIDPISAGLGFACNLEGRSFIGSQAIGKIASDGPSRVRIGLLPEGKRPVREGCPVLDDRGEKVGWVTSGAPSPTLGMPIAMAMVNASIGATKADWQASELQIDNRGNLQPATITQLPFYQPKEPKRSE
ncbi:MAG TPA: glycine cleavage system aminomethyltransferase GcvT [Planctomycetaceae bacterium]|nr:glycine cleavage system aminomethyltransferase GcvT [Planctomycetaceae bacterium]